MIDSPFGSLSISLLITGFSMLFLLLLKGALVSGSSFKDDDLDWLYKIMPTGWKFDLLSYSTGTQLTAIFAMLAFTAFFLFLGFRSFSKRDL